MKNRYNWNIHICRDTGIEYPAFISRVGQNSLSPQKGKCLERQGKKGKIDGTEKEKQKIIWKVKGKREMIEEGGNVGNKGK